MIRRLAFCFLIVITLGVALAHSAQANTAIPQRAAAPPVAAQVTAQPVPTPTVRARDQPPPPEVMKDLQPAINFAGIVGTLTVVVVLFGSIYLHRTLQARKPQK